MSDDTCSDSQQDRIRGNKRILKSFFNLSKPVEFHEHKWSEEYCITRKDGTSLQLFIKGNDLCGGWLELWSTDDIDRPYCGATTYVKDINNKEIYEGDRVKVEWTAELGVTELDCEAVGTVRYEKKFASFNVIFDEKFYRKVGEDGVYEQKTMQLGPSNEDDVCVSFEIIGDQND